MRTEIIRTPTEAAWDAPESHISVARQLQKIIPNSHILDQYSNPDNPLAHYHGTGKEIVEQTGGQFDFVVLTAGTGGTVSGVARYVREHVKNAKVIGVDPVGSILAGPGPIGTYKVEGIGYDFIPDVLDTSLVDEWIKTEDRESFLMARKLIRHEGMLVGGSSGSAAWAALQIGKKYGPKKRIVTLLPDSVRNYMTKFLDDRWMRENGFTEATWETSSLGELLRAMPARRKLVSAASADTVADAVLAMKEHGISQLPILDDGRLVGIVTESDLLSKLVEGHSLSSAVAEVMFRNVRTVNENDDARVLTELFAKDLVAVVVDDEKHLLGILTKMDLVDHLTGAASARREGSL
jgi:cystathionine beta-synthase